MNGSTYSKDAPQLTLAGVPGPEAQGTLFDVPHGRRDVAELRRCVTCGGFLIYMVGGPERCPRCEGLGAEAETLDLEQPS